jgi:diguanylate cyclase (GGDEF)-like protein
MNSRVVLSLLAISLTLVGLHRIGAMDTHYNILSKQYQHSYIANDDGISNANISIHKDYIAMECEIDNLKGNRFCELDVLLSNDISQGLNLSTYKNLLIDVEYTPPNAEQKTLPLRVYLRNYNPAYSTQNDITSSKYNSVQFEPGVTSSLKKIPLKSLQVATWWIEQNKIGFENAQVDLSNVVKIELTTAHLTETGRYRIKLNQFILQGELLSEQTLLKILLLAWLLTTIFLINRQRRILKQVSNRDPLTKALNRRGLNSWLDKQFTKGNASKNIVMFYIDIDDFKKVNDSYGHIVGDKLLINFSLIIREQIDFYFEKYKPNTNILARLSGDEFALVFINLGDNQIIDIAQNLMSRFTKEICIDDIFLRVNVSIGIAKSSDVHTPSAVNLMESADAAMYYAKRNGKNQFKIYNLDISKTLTSRKNISASLRKAIHNNDFTLVFMPIYQNNQSRSITSIEVLIRCTSPSLEGIGPEQFIPIAEEFGLIKAIDLWVLESSFKLMQSHQELIKAHSLLFCINVSALELTNKSFPTHLEHLLLQYNIDASCVELEITETSLINVDDDCLSILNSLKALGVKLSLDDFGTGYTAFNQLINYPVDTIKIDRSFVEKISSNGHHDATMVDIILSIAKSYELDVIAEGVETLSQLDYLEKRGCGAFQGYYLSRPISWEDIKHKLGESPSNIVK